MFSRYSVASDGSVKTEDSSEEDIKLDLQQKHYRLLNELQTMASELPMEYQQRIPQEMLSTLASCLLDNTVFEIVKGLKNIQHMTENQLFKSRMQKVDSLKSEKAKLIKENKTGVASGSVTVQQATALEDAFEKRFEDELRKTDMEIILDLDQVTIDQQVTLERAGVPGFHVTNKQKEVQLQMHILSFINNLSALEDID